MFNLPKNAIYAIVAALLVALGIVYYIYKGPTVPVTVPDIFRPSIDSKVPDSTPNNNSDSRVAVDYAGIEKMFSPYPNARLPHRDRIVYVCSGYGCEHSTRFMFSSEHLNEFRYNFNDAKDADHERRIIALTIAQMEKKVGEKIGEDKAGEDWRGNSKLSQMGVSDEAINTTSYLVILARNNLLKYHNIKAPVWKGTKMFAVIEEIGSKDIYGINSSVSKNGEVPLMIKGQNL